MFFPPLLSSLFLEAFWVGRERETRTLEDVDVVKLFFMIMSLYRRSLFWGGTLLGFLVTCIQPRGVFQGRKGTRVRVGCICLVFFSVGRSCLSFSSLFLNAGLGVACLVVLGLFDTVYFLTFPFASPPLPLSVIFPFLVAWKNASEALGACVVFLLVFVLYFQS